MFIVEYYTDAKGKSPVEEFIKNISDTKLRAKVFRAILLLEEGNALDIINSKYVTNEIFELKIKQSSNNVRILYFFRRGQRIILTHGFIKKTQKIPRKELEIAINRRNDFIEREEK